MRSTRQIGENLAARLDDAVRGRLAEEPFSSVTNDFGLEVILLEVGVGDRRCSCDGTFDADRGAITVARSPFSRRSSFTCLHELGHALLWRDPNLLSRLEVLDRDNAGRIAEERVCDAFAAAILLPDELVNEVLADGTLRGEHFTGLFSQSGASREACAVRLSQRLRGDGHVMLADTAGVALFTASTGSYWVARGVPQGSDHISVAAARRGRATQETFVRFRSERTQPMFGDAVSDGRFVYVVLAEAPQWPVEGPAVHRFAKDRAEALDGECGNCGHVFQSYRAPCSRCGALECPECGKCECRSGARERVCAKCYLLKPSHLFSEGSTYCRDCS